MADENVTLDNLKSLSMYGIVIISGHGMLHRDVPWEPYYFMLATREKVTEDSKDKYSRDIARKYLSYIKYRGEDYFAIRYQFIVTYNKSFKNSLIYLDVCEAFTQPYFPYAFLAQGAGAVVGYNATVPIVYASATGNSLFKHLLLGDTVGEGVDKARDENNANSGAPYYAKLSVTGNKKLTIVPVDLQDGGFEEYHDYYGNKNVLKYWSVIKTSSYPEKPSQPPVPEGKYYNIIDYYAQRAVYQSFKLPPDKKTISFSYKYDGLYNLRDSIYTGLCNFQFGVTVSDTENNAIKLLSYDFTIPTTLNFDKKECWSCYYGNPTTLHIDACCNKYVSSSWQRVEVPISSLADKFVTLKFAFKEREVWSEVGCWVRVAIDNVTIQ